MESPLAALGIELIVADLDRAIELFVDVMGCQLLSREPSTLVVGEVAVIDAGSIVISLLAPALAGEGAVLANREPRLSQIIFGGSRSAEIAAAFGRAASAGLALSELVDDRFHITPESVEGALGQPTALVTVPLPQE